MAPWITRDQPRMPLTLPVKIRNIEIDGGVVRVRRRYRGDWERPFSWFSCILVVEQELSITRSSYAIKLSGLGSFDLPQSKLATGMGLHAWVQLANLLNGQDVHLCYFSARA